MAALWISSALERGAGAIAGTVLLLVVWRWGDSRQPSKQLGAFSIAIGCLAAATMFACADGRRPYELSPGGKRAVQAAFLPLIPQSASVYWQNNLTVSWNELHRSSYASNIQLAGLAFNRGTAIEGARRMERISRLGGEDALLAPVNRQTRLRARAELPRASLAGLAYVCADPLLDFVVLGTPLGGAIAQARDAEYDKTYYLYECARLRGR